MNGLAEVLQAHHAMVSGDVDGWHVICRCGYNELGNDPTTHVADQVTAHLAERLAAPEVVEAVRLRIYSEDYFDGCSGLTTRDSEAAATAALDAVRVALGVTGDE